MKLVVEFDYGWFLFSFKDYLFPPRLLRKELRLHQLFSWLVLPATFLASFFDSIRIFKTTGL